MRRPTIRHTGAGLLMLAALAVAGCQGEETGTDAGSTVAADPTVTTEDAGASTPAVAPTTEGPAATGDDATQTTSAPVTAPTTEAEVTTEAEQEPEGEKESEDADAAAGDVIVVREGTVFTTPAQAAFCSLSAPDDGMAAAISCEVMQSSVPPGEELMGTCSPDGYGWYVNFFEDSGHGGFWCNHHEGIIHAEGVDLADEPWVDQSQVHTLPTGTRVPILDYGRVLRAGGMSCSVQPDGLTCSNPDTGHGFTLNTGSYVSW